MAQYSYKMILLIFALFWTFVCFENPLLLCNRQHYQMYKKSCFSWMWLFWRWKYEFWSECTGHALLALKGRRWAGGKTEKSGPGRKERKLSRKQTCAGKKLEAVGRLGNSTSKLHWRQRRPRARITEDEEFWKHWRSTAADNQFRRAGQGAVFLLHYSPSAAGCYENPKAWWENHRLSTAVIGGGGGPFSRYFRRPPVDTCIMMLEGWQMCTWHVFVRGRRPGLQMLSWEAARCLDGRSSSSPANEYKTQAVINLAV